MAEFCTQRPLFAKLQLGCGANVLAGWLNTDIDVTADGVSFLDFTKPFPFPDQSFDAVFCEHTIEHVEKEQALFMCGEVYRVLKSSRCYRVVTPSLESMLRMLFLPESPATIRYLAWFRDWAKMPAATISDTFNAIFYNHGHRHIYMKSELGEILKAIGFIDPCFYQASQYGDPIFNGSDAHGRWIGDDINVIESFAVEVRKP